MPFFWYAANSLLTRLPSTWWSSDTHRMIWTLIVGLLAHVVLCGVMREYSGSIVSRILCVNYQYLVAADVIIVAVLFRQRWGHTLTSHYGDALLGAPSSQHGPHFKPVFVGPAPQKVAVVEGDAAADAADAPVAADAPDAADAPVAADAAVL
jgi:hypothetical protein